MPYQSVATLFIIGGAFGAAGGLVGLVNYVYTGKRKRETGNDHWTHHLRQRDMAIEYVLKSQPKAPPKPDNQIVDKAMGVVWPSKPT